MNTQQHTKQRLTAQDWLMAGFRALARAGSKALRAEALARDLNTTKGSFYWHFKDLPDFMTRLIVLWEEMAFDAVVASLDTTAPARQRLEQLCMLAVSFRDPSYGGDALEPALRAWALDDQQVAEAVNRVDARRLAYLSTLCEECGLTDPAIPPMLYSLAIGLEITRYHLAPAVMTALLQRLT
jgi:AcrR family transcriptional regulator